MAAKVAAIPDIPATIDPAVAKVLRAVKEVLEVGAGRRPKQSQLDRYVTFRDLTGDVGLFTVGKGGNIVPGSGGGGSESGTGVQPPQPTEFSANGAFSSIILSWNDPFRAYAAHAYTEIWRATANDRSQAVRVGTSSSFVWADDDVRAGQTYYYWIRFVSTAGLTGAFNAGPTDGTLASLALDPDYVLDQLTAKAWAADTYYPAFAAVAPSTSVTIDGVAVAFQAQGAGTSGSAEPDWQSVTELGGTITDGTITWAAIDANKVPFVTGSVNGHPVVFMHGAVMEDASIADAKIKNLAADKLFAASGTLAQALIGEGDITNAMIGNVIQSSAFQAGTAGWMINKDGTAEFHEITVYDSSGNVLLSSGSGIAPPSSFPWSSITGKPDFGALSLVDQLTAENISTYMAAAAIGQALIGNAAVGTLQIEGNAATVPTQLNVNWSTTSVPDTPTETVIASASWSSPAALPTMIAVDIEVATGTNSSDTISLKIIFNGTVMGQDSNGMTEGYTAGPAETNRAVRIFPALAIAGTNTLTVVAHYFRTSGGTHLVSAKGALQATENKR